MNGTTHDRTMPAFGSAVITGATGFLGTNLCERLHACGVRVTGLVRSTSDASRRAKLEALGTVMETDGSVASLTDALRDANPDLVFHLAANYVGTHGPDDVAPLLSDNVGLTASLCEAATTAQCHALVAAGTAWQNAGSAPGNPSPSPNTLYAATKQAADEIIGYYARARDLNAITLKIYDSYGPDDPRRKFLAVLTETAARGETLRASPGDQQLHMVHVDDLIDGFTHAGNRLASGTAKGYESYTLPSIKAVTLRELADVWQVATGVRAEIEWGATPYRPGEVLTPWEGKPLPGWSPAISLEDGLRRLQD